MGLGTKIVQGVKITLVSTTISQLSRGVLLLLLTRYLLDPAGYGLLYFALSVLMIVQVFSSLSKSGARYVTEYFETEAEMVPHIIRLTLGYLLLAAGTFSVGLVVFDDVIAGLLNEPALPPLLVVGAGYVVVVSLYTFFHVTFQAFNRLDWSAVISIVESLLRLVFVVVFVLLGLDVLGALLGYIASYAVAALVGAGILYVGYYRDAEKAPSREPGLGRQILSYSVPITGINAATVADARLTTLLIGVFIDPTAVGFYTLARQIVQFSVVPATALGFTISPRLGEQKASENVESATAIYEQSLTYVLLLFIPAGVGLVLVARPVVVYVFGAEYLGAVPVLQVFGAFVIIRAITKITNNSLDYLGEARNRARAEITFAVANIGLNLVLIPWIGVLGAAIATVVSKGLYTFVNVYYVYQALSFDRSRVLRETGLVTGIAGGIGVAVLFMRPLIGGIVSLFAVVGVTVLLWFALSLLTGVLDIYRIKAML